MENVLSICTGMGLLDLAFMHAGFTVRNGCESDIEQRQLYGALVDPRAPIEHDLIALARNMALYPFTRLPRCGLIGGPPCQSHSKLRAMRSPKFPDLTKHVRMLMRAQDFSWFVLENVVPIDIPGAVHTRLNAMHFYKPHQSRERWFTHSANITPPKPKYRGTVDSLMAYPVVAGRIYGPKRGAILQGWPAAAKLPFPCAQVQKGLANAVPYPLGLAWANAVRESLA